MVSRSTPANIEVVSLNYQVFSETVVELSINKSEHSGRFSACFFNRPTLDVARSLLGHRLVRRLNGSALSSVICEVEAYLPMILPPTETPRTGEND